MPNRAQTYLAWHITAKAAEDVTDIDIFDVIGGDGFWESGVKASDFVKELRAVTTSKINLHINSPGGYVNDGKAMYNAIKQHKAHVTAYIESEAASAASFVAMAADVVSIAKNANIMIHDALSLTIGNAADLRQLADELDAESNVIAEMYADRAGGTVDEWRAAMQANNGFGTTYRGQAAVDAGLADELTSEPQRRNLQHARIAALRSMNVKPMSGADLANLHTVIETLETIHDSSCDMGADCPMAESESESGGVTVTVDKGPGDWWVALIPPLSDSAGYQTPIPSIEGLLSKYPLTFAGE